jgi:hypothetical protein
MYRASRPRRQPGLRGMQAQCHPQGGRAPRDITSSGPLRTAQPLASERQSTDEDTHRAVRQSARVSEGLSHPYVPVQKVSSSSRVSRHPVISFQWRAVASGANRPSSQPSCHCPRSHPRLVVCGAVARSSVESAPVFDERSLRTRAPRWCGNATTETPRARHVVPDGARAPALVVLRRHSRGACCARS